MNFDEIEPFKTIYYCSFIFCQYLYKCNFDLIYFQHILENHLQLRKDLLFNNNIYHIDYLKYLFIIFIDLLFSNLSMGLLITSLKLCSVHCEIKYFQTEFKNWKFWWSYFGIAAWSLTLQCNSIHFQLLMHYFIHHQNRSSLNLDYLSSETN